MNNAERSNPYISPQLFKFLLTASSFASFRSQDRLREVVSNSGSRLQLPLPTLNTLLQPIAITGFQEDPKFQRAAHSLSVRTTCEHIPPAQLPNNSLSREFDQNLEFATFDEFVRHTVWHMAGKLPQAKWEEQF